MGAPVAVGGVADRNAAGVTQFERALGGFALVTLVAAGLVAVSTLMLASRRERGWRPWVVAAFAGSMVCVLGVTLQPSPGTPAGVEIMPFQNLGSPSGWDQVISNLFLTVPSGLLFGLLASGRCHAISVGCGMSIAIELAQLVLPLGRIAATEDALLTSLGFVIPAVLVQLVRRLLVPDLRTGQGMTSR